MPGRNVSDLEPQKIVEEIAGIENLESGSALYVNADNFDLQLTSDFDWENDGAIRFFYMKGSETLSAQLRLFASEKQFFVTEHSNWPDQDRIFSLESYLNALKYLPKEQIRELSPDADLYQVVFLDAGGPEDYDNVITYTPDGAERIDGWLIHLGVLPFRRTASNSQSWGAKGSEEVIHLFYGPRGIKSEQKLTLDDVILLSQKGDALTWSDFERYQGRDVGSGLYIMRYEIDELFDVLVGGVPDETPMYIYLRANNEADDEIDIRTGDVSAFISAHRNDVPKVVEPFDALNKLDYQPYTCDGLPEYQLIDVDGTVYSINFSENWVWRGNREQAELPAELIPQLKRVCDGMDENKPIETP